MSDVSLSELANLVCTGESRLRRIIHPQRHILRGQTLDERTARLMSLVLRPRLVGGFPRHQTDVAGETHASVIIG